MLKVKRPAILGILIVGITAFFLFFPFFNLILFGFREGGGWTGWIQLVWNEEILGALKDTAILVGSRVTIGLGIALVISWLIARTNMPGSKAIEFMFWIAFFIPSLPMLTGWIVIFEPRFGVINSFWMNNFGEPIFNIFSYSGIVLAHLSSTTLPVMVMLLTPAFRYLSTDFEEASRVFGASHWITFRKIAIPLIMPTILVVMMLAVIHGLGAFEVELILGIPAKIFVFSTLIYDKVNWAPPDFASAAMLATIFIVIMFALVFCYRWIVRKKNYITITGKGFNSRQVDLGRWKYAAAAFCWGIIAIFFLLPLASLFVGTFMTRFGFFHLQDPYTTAHWIKVLSNSDLPSAIFNSLLVGGCVVFFGIFLFTALAYFIQRSRMPGRGLVDMLVWIPWAMSGILLGLALLRFVLAVPFLSVLYGTVTILVVALIIKEIPLGAQIIKSSLFQMNHELEEASSISGASRFNTFRRIVMPLLKPTLISVSLIVFVAALKEISALILLSAPGTQTVSVMLLNYIVDQRMEQAAVLGVILSMIIAVVALISRSFGLNIGPKM